LQQIKKNWGVKLLSKAARTFGYDVIPTRKALQRNISPLFKFFGISVVWGNWTEKDYIGEGFLKNAGLYSIITRICKTAATAPFKVYKIKNQGKFQRHIHNYKAWTGKGATKESIQRAMLIKQQVFEEDNDHELNKLIDKPNNYQGGSQFTQNSIGFKLITGNRLLFLKTLDMGANEGKPVQIYNLPPQHIRMILSSLFEVQGYELQLNAVTPIGKEFIIHSRYWNPEFDGTGSHMWGLSPLRAASRNLDRTDAAEDRSVAMLQNAGAAGIVFAKEGWKVSGQDMTIEQAAATKRQFNEDVLGTENAGRIALANQELGYINFAMTAVEMAIIEQEKYSQDQLCNIYGVPPGLFQSSANATDNNIQAWNKQLITQAAIPALAELRDDWNEIAKRFGDDIYVDFDISVYPELQEDLEKVARIMGNWWFTGNEKRLAMNHDEDATEPMMNRYLVPAGLTDIADLDPENLDRVMEEEDENDKV
jgi:HK97 family phage portal protein